MRKGVSGDGEKRRWGEREMGRKAIICSGS